MLDAPTVLLVRRDRAPDGLDRLLEERRVYAEDSTVEDLGPTALAAVPELIVTFGHEDVGSVVDAVRDLERNVPVVVVCERRHHRDVESQQGAGVAALVPSEISDVGLALRIVGLAKNAAQGKPLRVGLVPRPATSSQRERAPASVGTAAKGPARIPPPAPVSVPRPPVDAGASRMQPPPPVAPQISAPSVQTKERGSVPPPPIATPPPSVSQASRQRTLAGLPRLPSPPALSPSDPSPVVAVPAARSARATVHPRIVLIDDEASRAGALARALGELGVEVTTVSPDHADVRWPVLRRFAPHAVLVDERALAKGTRQVVGAIRRDPFLQYVLLLPARFERLHSESSGAADLSVLQAQIATLGEPEARWLEQTKQAARTTAELSQVPLTRVVGALAHSGCAWTLTATASQGTLRWEIAEERVGSATVETPHDVEGTLLDSEAALRWLLFRDVHTVALSPLTSPGGSCSERASEFLERMCACIDAPSEVSRAPAAADGELPAIPAAPRVPASSSMQSVGGLDAPSETTLVGTVLEHSAELMRRAALQGGGLRRRVGVALRATMRRPGARLVARRASTTSRAARRALQPAVAWIRERTGLSPLLQAQIAVGALLFLGAFVLVSMGNGTPAPERGAVVAAVESPPAAPAEAPLAHASDPTMSPDAPKPPPERKALVLGLWRVAEDADVATCPQGQSDAMQPASHADGYWRAARQALMKGDTDEAHRMMCRSVVLDPGGPAALGLAELYLARRGVEEAAKLLDRFLASKPQHRAALELLGDVRSQQGRDEEALAIWLATMELSPGDTSKRQLVARSLYHDGRKAMGGDRPRAERLWRRAATLDPSNHVVAGKLATLFLKDDLAPAAALWAKRAIGVEHYNGDARMVLGDIARAKRDYSAAQVEYRQIPTGDPNYPRAQRWLESMPAE